MRVVTLDPEKFQQECSRLGTAALQSGPYRLIVAIRNGGAYVADAMQKAHPELRTARRCDVSLQRASTPGRTRRAGGLLRRLPRPLLNLMRMAESRFDALTESREKNRRLAEERLKLPPALENPSGLDQLSSLDQPEGGSVTSGGILIVDDAVDSGVTLSVVRDRIAALYPDAQIKTAALTVTRSNPMITPDFTLYTDHTLLRFPWSNDYRHD